MALEDLHGAVDLHGRILNGVIDAESAFPGLEGGSETYDEAVCKAAGNARAAAGYLIEVISAHCGTEAAAYVNGLPSGLMAVAS